MAHLIDLLRSIWSVWESEVRGRSGRPWESEVRGRSERPWESDQASHTSTGGSNAFSREISQMAPRIGLSRPVCVRGQSDSHGLSLRPLTTKSCDLCGRPICEAEVGGRIWTLWLAQTDHMRKCGRPCAWEAEFRDFQWEAEVGGRSGRPRCSLIGSDRSVRESQPIREAPLPPTSASHLGLPLKISKF